MAYRTVGAGQSIALTGTATTSTAFKVQSNVLRIVASGAHAYVAIGTDPVATTTDFLVSSGEPESLAMLKMSQRVVGITTIDGCKTVLSAPEGTQMPFNLGDRVVLDYEGDSTNDSNYTTKISDKIKEILFNKSAERVDAFKTDVANGVFGDVDVEDEELDDEIVDEVEDEVETEDETEVEAELEDQQ